MEIPKTVKIGGVNYDVRLASEWPDHDYDDGEIFDSSKVGNVIFIRETLSDDAKAITLIHESLHAMNSTMNHEFLDSLSKQIYQFFVDNKLLK